MCYSFFFSHAESLGSSVPLCGRGSEQGDIVWCLAFLGTLCREPIFKVKKCSQCGRERGHWRSKLVIHDAFMKGWQNATAYKLTQAAMINPHSPLRARKTNSALKMKRLIIMFILSLFLTPVPKDFLNRNALLGLCCCGSANLHIFDVDFVWSFVTFFLWCVWFAPDCCLRYTHPRIQSKYINE